jgi:hypothetical protein
MHRVFERGWRRGREDGGGRRDMFIEERRKGGWRESGVLMSNERGWRRGREDGSRVRQPSEITKWEENPTTARMGERDDERSKQL